MAASMSFSNITKKWNFQPILDIELFLIHLELELDMLGIARKLVKNVVYLWRQTFEKIIFFLPTSCLNSRQSLLRLMDI
jgi:hypothetical protein